MRQPSAVDRTVNVQLPDPIDHGNNVKRTVAAQGASEESKKASRWKLSEAESKV